MSRLLRASGVGYQLASDKTLLAAVDVEVWPGEMLGLIGPNGAGKTTLLKLLAGLTQPSTGEVTLGGKSLQLIAARDRARQLGYLEQNAELHWPLTVESLVALGRMPHQPAWRGLSPADKAAIETALQHCELGSLRQRAANTLSGGELLRAKLARVLAGEPEIILADEPVAALDIYHQLHSMELLREHCQRGGSAVVVLHDLALAARFCDRLLLLNHGKPVAAGEPREVLTAERIASVYRVAVEAGSLLPLQRVE